MFSRVRAGITACGSATHSDDQTASGGAAPGGAGGAASSGGLSGTGGTTTTTGGQAASGGTSTGGGQAGGGSPPSGGSPNSGGAGPASGGAASGGSDTGSGGLQDDCSAPLRKANRDATEAAIDGLFVEKNVSVIDQYWADPYLQHNPIGQSGVAAFKSLMSSIVSSSSFSYTRHRTLADCDLSVVHGTYSQTGVIFDMFRVSDGKLIEHWDSDTNQASEARPGLDGEVALDETVDSPGSAALVRGFIEAVLIEGDRDVVGDYLAEGYFDHRSGAAVGPSSIFPHLDQDDVTYSEIHHLIADGNFVFVLSEGKQGTTPYGFYDLFRIEGDKIIERWDSKRQVPNSTASGLEIF